MNFWLQGYSVFFTGQRETVKYLMLRGWVELAEKVGGYIWPYPSPFRVGFWGMKQHEWKSWPRDSHALWFSDLQYCRANAAILRLQMSHSYETRILTKNKTDREQEFADWIVQSVWRGSVGIDDLMFPKILLFSYRGCSFQDLWNVKLHCWLSDF